jgi:hypothetical protein
LLLADARVAGLQAFLPAAHPHLKPDLFDLVRALVRQMIKVHDLKQGVQNQEGARLTQGRG